jgi:hypothetical protein
MTTLSDLIRKPGKTAKRVSVSEGGAPPSLVGKYAIEKKDGGFLLKEL